MSQPESGAAPEGAALTDQAQSAANNLVDSAQELANTALDAGQDAVGAAVTAALTAQRTIGQLLETLTGSLLKKNP